MPESLRPLAYEHLDSFLRAGLLVSGARVAVIHGGRERLDLAFGTDHTGAEMTSAHVSCLYCCSKLPVYTAMVAAIDEGTLRLETTIGDVLPDANEWVAGCTIADMLTQRGGFSVMPGPSSRFVPEHLRRTSHQWLSPSDAAPRGTQVYSVSEAGWLATLMLERTSDRHYRELFPSVLADVLGHDVLRSADGPLATTFQRVEGRAQAVPMLDEATRAVRAQWNPSLGWYASAMALARLGAALSAAWNGHAPLGAAAVRYATEPRHRPVADPALKREASFGLGFWTDLSAYHDFGSAGSAASFGHASLGGTSFLFVDPERDLSIAGCFDLAVGGDAGPEPRRPALVQALVEAADE